MNQPPLILPPQPLKKAESAWKRSVREAQGSEPISSVGFALLRRGYFRIGMVVRPRSDLLYQSRGLSIPHREGEACDIASPVSVIHRSSLIGCLCAQNRS